MCDGSVECARRFGAAGAPAMLLALWRTDDMAEAGVVSGVVNALCACALDPQTLALLTAAEYEEAALADLNKHLETPTVVQALGSLLWLMTEDEESFARLLRLDTVAQLAVALDRHTSDATTAAVLAHALTPLLIDVKVAHNLREDDELDVPGILVDTLETHGGNAATAEALVDALKELCHHEPLHERLIEVETIEVLTRLQRDATNAAHSSLAAACGKVLNILLMIPDSGDES